ncbi:MAG TPA: Asp-tRNA(Asn)/Glu-tRNA(Gln) amidotransferase subunit GatC [Candidatus Polarisedimenticolia bacterium]|jgi:aspartyl-tRNA(Asn)/glutamyl-tRNA(Gln) amidotransferase subunit C|nr:Asp-tRNA(Asn)/Glu-tRNA(Gln) amidotransferase subunit GatC [Candidatus Polarisedimenticolia bacterium]
MAITRNEVLHLAKLANLEFNEEEIDRFTRQISSILDYVARLNELDTSAIEPTTSIESGALALRDDVLVPSIPRMEALANAPESDGVHFKVPKVIG